MLGRFLSPCGAVGPEPVVHVSCQRDTFLRPTEARICGRPPPASVHSRRATVATACLGCRASTSAPIVTVALRSRYGSRFIGNSREAPHKAIWPVTGRANRHLGLAGSSGTLAMCLETTLPATEWVARWHCRQCPCCCRERPWGSGCCQ